MMLKQANWVAEPLPETMTQPAFQSHVRILPFWPAMATNLHRRRGDELCVPNLKLPSFINITVVSDYPHCSSHRLAMPEVTFAVLNSKALLAGISRMKHRSEASREPETDTEQDERAR